MVVELRNIEGNLWEESESEKAMKRAGHKLSKAEDFGDGGAFPEIHYAQWMGRSRSAKTLPLTVDEHRNRMVRQDENAMKIVYSQPSDLVPVFANMDVDEKTTQQTKAALDQILSAAQPKNVPQTSTDSKFLKYKERIIRMVDMALDPLEPPKFKHTRVPKGSGSPPVPVMHSPPRPVSVKDQQEWKIPPCISNWKNSRGYMIPLHNRVAADARGLQDVQISANHAKLSEALYVGEEKAREAVAVRSKVLKEMMIKEKEKKYMSLRVLAHKARSLSVEYERVRDGLKETEEEKEERFSREKVGKERQRQRGREKRAEAKDAGMGKKRKIRDRDIREKVALGIANIGARGGEVMYDQRLFNQEKGVDSGFGFGTEEAYNIYDKALFTAQSTLTTLYNPKKDRDDMYGGAADEQPDKIKCVKLDRAFTDSSKRSDPRDRPVEFDKEQDPFGLNQFLKDVKMKASGGSKRDVSDKDLP